MIKNLKALRKQHGLSQQQLADMIGVSQQSVNKYENHSIEPDIRTLIAIAECFHTSVDHLIGHHEPEQPAEIRLSTEEAAFLTHYRRLSERQQKSIIEVMENYLSP